jgi:hypothetical protein
VVTDIQKQVRHPALRWMAATLDGRIEGSDAVYEAKFMLPWAFSEEAAAEKYMPQLQHNMWVGQRASPLGPHAVEAARLQTRCHRTSSQNGGSPSRHVEVRHIV